MSSVSALDGPEDSSTFAHALEFDTDGVIPSVEGAANGWTETGWTIDAVDPPSLSVAGGVMAVDTVGVGGGHDVRQPTDTSAWATEVDPGTSYTFEARLKVTGEGGANPGFNIWLGNGTAAETAFLMVETGRLMWGKATQVLNEGDNSADFVTVRVAHDGATGLHTVWRNGIQVGTDLGASDVQSANNWIILVDFGGSNEVAADVDYVRWDATGAYEPDDGSRDAADFAHKLLFEVDGEIPSVEGAEDGWEETSWNFGQPPSLAVAGGVMAIDTVGVGGGHDVRQPTSGSAWADEVGPDTSYTFETRLKVTGEGGSTPGFSIWLGNGTASETAVAQVRTNQIMWGTSTQLLDESDNSAGFVTVRIAHDGTTGLNTVWRDGVELATDLGTTDIQHANNWVILADFGGSNEVAADVDFIRWDATGAFAPGATDSVDFAHKLEFEVDGVLPSEEGTDDGWQEVSWNLPGAPPSMEVAAGLMAIDTVGVGGGHDVRQPVDTSAWAVEVDPGTSYSFETRLRVTDEGGENPGFNIWLGNGTASETVFLMVETARVVWGKATQVLHEGDNSTDFVTIRVAHDGDTGQHTVWRNGVPIGADLVPSDVQSGNNWIILADFGSTNEVAAEVDYICWDATGAYPPPGSGGDGEPPAAPTGLVARGGVGAAALDWDSNTEGDLAGYAVYRSEVMGGPYDLLAEGIATSAYVDETATDGTTVYYVVTAVDASENESDPSDEADATPGFGEEREADTFAHKLGFEVDGVLPSVEGIADGWLESGAWVVDGAEAPSLSVAGGSLIFDTVGLGSGAFDIDQPSGASAWSDEVGSSTSFSFEVRMKVTGSGGAEPGASIWLANAAGGGGRSLTRVTETAVFRGLGPGNQLHEGDNASKFVNIRVGHDGVTGQNFVWRNGILVGEGLPGDGNDSRSAVFLIDFGGANQCGGEFDYVCWDASGLYPPATIVDETPPAAPTGLAAAGGYEAAALDWDSNSEDDVIGYNLYRSVASGGPYDLLVESNTPSQYTDGTVENGIEYFYVVTALDASDNESDPSGEASAMPKGLSEHLEASAFAHKLLFEVDGVLASEEGAADGWQETGAWEINGLDPPSLSVFGGSMVFNTVGVGGGYDIRMSGPGLPGPATEFPSAWQEEIGSETSYSFEVRLKVTANDLPEGGVMIWLGDGDAGNTCYVTVTATSVTMSQTNRANYAVLHEGDNASDFITLRIAREGISGKQFIWRNGELIGDGLAPTFPFFNFHWAVLGDVGSQSHVIGEFDYVCWDSTGAYQPAEVFLLAGDCNNDGSRNVSDVICMIHAIFPGFILVGASAGDPPCATQEGNDAVLDLNGDGRLDGADVFYLAEFLFSGGAPPAQGAECFGLAEEFGCSQSEVCPAS